MTDPVFVSKTNVVGSKMKSENGYGQNGYQGPSSDTPGQHTTSGFLPKCEVVTGDWQTRKVSAEQYPTHPGMKSPGEPAKIPTATNRRAGGKSANPKSFQR